MMSQVRKFFILMVINIFAMLLVTVMYEYINLSERFQTLEQNIQVAVESSVDASYGAEELFSANSSNYESSYGAHKSSKLNNNLLVCANGNFYSTNVYNYAMYFDSSVLGKSPYYKNNVLVSLPSSSEINNVWKQNNNTAQVFKWLYGGVGCPSSASIKDWWKLSNSTKSVYNSLYNSSALYSSDRLPVPEFKAYYDAVGKYVTSTVNVKQKKGNSFVLVEKEVPLLVNMGLEFHDYNSWDSNYSMPNYISSVKVGKKELSNNAVGYSYYYITPYSLGVTYIPTKVLYPTLLNNLNTIVSLNKLAGGSLSNDSDTKAILSSAKGCISTEVYNNNGGTSVPHISEKDELIVNDGAIEYDLNSLRVSVDYVVVDFKDWQTNQSKQELLSRVEGCISNVQYNASSQPTAVKDYSDTLYSSVNTILGNSFGTNKGKTTKRVVAKITTQIKVHVCYDSSIIQWCCQRFTGGKSEHFDIKGYNSPATDDGIWYEYTTYRCHAR